MSKELILVTGPFCHLCDSARQVVLPLVPAGMRLREISIDEDEALRHRYQFSIPVLVVLDNGGEALVDSIVAEKGWPFSPGQARRLVQRWCDDY